VSAQPERLDPQARSHDERFASPDIHYTDVEADHPQEILWWAYSTIDRIAVATSFQASGMVILHMTKELRPDVPVLFLDTGFHFPETLEFRQHIAEAWNLNVIDLRGEHGSAKRQAELYGSGLYKRDPDKCCFINKVLPLQNALEDYDGWISGLRRDQSPLRAETPVVEAQMLPSGNEVMKIHPLAHWTREDVNEYVKRHDVPTHPLLEMGFPSIGCFPCTRAVQMGEAERAGRWDGIAKTECGIHSFGKEHGPKQTEAEQ
jgi:phosphoadenosine phosphosulfate reductase